MVQMLILFSPPKRPVEMYVDNIRLVKESVLKAEGLRAFCWWLDLDQQRTPLAAIPLENGSGQAVIQLGPGREGSFLVTLEPLEGEPGPASPVVLEAVVN